MILERIDEGRYCKVLPKWVGQTVVIIGGGDSLSQSQIDLLERARAVRDDLRCIVVNDAYLRAPWADLLYFADAHWHMWHKKGMVKRPGLTEAEVRQRFESFKGQICSIESAVKNVDDPRVVFLRNLHGSIRGTGVSLKPDAIATGHNSGFMALNIAVLSGSRFAVLLGFDGRPNPKNGRSHWFGEHLRPIQAEFWPLMRQSFSAAERELDAVGMKVVNCSPGTFIDSFTKMALEDVLGL